MLEILKKNYKLDSNIDNALLEFRHLNENDKLGKALHEMHSHKLKEMPVTDKNGDITGNIKTTSLLLNYHQRLNTTDRDFGEKPNTPLPTHQTEHLEILSLPVKNFIDNDYLLIEEDLNLDDAVSKMIEGKDSHLVVLKNNTPYGLIIGEDIINIIYKSFQGSKGKIEFTGLDELNLQPHDINYIKETASLYASKYERYFHNLFDLKIDVKKERNEGKNKLYTIYSRLTYPGSTVTSNKREWDIIKALRRTLEKIEIQLSKKYT
ncbi:MAG: CBS domain-containing protein [Nanobdellota archaeon]